METTDQKTIDQMSPKEIEQYLADRKKKEQEEMRAKKNELEADKNNFLFHNASKFRQFQVELRELKELAISQANELYERMFTIEGETPKEAKSFSLKNTEDNIKITVERQERFEFTDGAIVHINAIKDIFKAKFAQRNKGLYNILDGLLIKGREGEYDPKLLAKARRQVRELGDEKLMEQFDKLDDCQRVRGTSLYCRLYVRDDKTKKYKDVSLNFSSL